MDRGRAYVLTSAKPAVIRQNTTKLVSPSGMIKQVGPSSPSAEIAKQIGSPSPSPSSSAEMSKRGASPSAEVVKQAPSPSAGLTKQAKKSVTGASIEVSSAYMNIGTADNTSSGTHIYDNVNLAKKVGASTMVKTDEVRPYRQKGQYQRQYQRNKRSPGYRYRSPGHRSPSPEGRDHYYRRQDKRRNEDRRGRHGRERAKSWVARNRCLCITIIVLAGSIVTVGSIVGIIYAVCETRTTETETPTTHSDLDEVPAIRSAEYGSLFRGRGVR